MLQRLAELPRHSSVEQHLSSRHLQALAELPDRPEEAPASEVVDPELVPDQTFASRYLVLGCYPSVFVPRSAAL